MEHIDVTFGGRSVRLTDCSGFYMSDDESLCVWQRRDKQWRCEFGFGGVCLKSDMEPDPQAAVAAVESKLRDLRDQLTSILGDER